jgi:mono/diheme cytochrome c family protein
MKTTVALIFTGALAFFGMVALALDTSADHGKEVYAAQKCALCHSIGGIGGKKMALDGVGSRLKPEDLKKWIRTPKEMKTDTTMKSYPNLTERDVDDLTSFLMTLR